MGFTTDPVGIVAGIIGAAIVGYTIVVVLTNIPPA